ncbi:ATP-binding cassette sub-family G member 1-like [Brevipalpus obovatus]|uniref:ATP-binding cassette sub-family G member 1-like n=1 Tax=Brevipalpus obovatus TaxID=246614 RepID=UPI003D9E8409
MRPEHRPEHRPLPIDDSDDNELTSSTVNDNDLGEDGNGGVDNVCLNIDKYLDELEKSIEPSKINHPTRGFNSGSLPSTSTDYKNWSMVSKSSIRPLSPDTLDGPMKMSADPSDTFLTFPYEDPGNSGGNIRLVWRNITYQSSSQTSISGRRLILSKQNGQISGGQLTAIIGPSGAGKSTLLESLAGRRSRGLKGRIMVIYDRDYVEDGRKVRISFIGQKDQLINVLTVRETLFFSSRIKNYRNIKNYYYHSRLVDSILKALNLEQCADVRVSKISGGQLKRVTFAIELISGPDILMLDEPTSGLDSSSTYSCISLLRKLADLKRAGNYFRPPAIICSIHQPSARVLNIFHQMYVLSSDGRCLYHGSPKSLLNHLAKHDLNCPQFHNPADFIIEVASGDYGLEPVNQLAIYESNRQMVLVNEDKAYLSGKKLHLSTISNDGKHRSKSTDTEDEVLDEDDANPSKRVRKRNLTVRPDVKMVKVHRIVDRMKSESFPVFSHFWLLLGRTYMTTIRDPKLTWFRIFQAIFIGFLMSYLYDHPIGEANGCFPSPPSSYIPPSPFSTSSSSSSSPSSASTSPLQPPSRSTSTSSTFLSSTPAPILIPPSGSNITNSIEQAVAATQDNIAFIFFITLFTVMACMMPTVLTFPAEVAVHIQERNNGWYSCWTYYWTKIIADTPYQIAVTTLFCSIVYPMTGQIWDKTRFSLFVLVSVLVSNIAQCVGMLFGTIYVHSVQNAVFMAPLSMAPVFLLSGFFGKISKVPVFLKPIATISYVRYAFEAFLIVLYGFDRCPPLAQTAFRGAASINNRSLVIGDRSYIREVASENSIATEMPLPNSDYEDTGDGGEDDGLLGMMSTTDASYSSDNSDYTEPPPLYDSLPKVWSGFYNPIDYLSLAQGSFSSSSSNSGSKVKSSSIILQHFDLNDDDLWRNIAILIVSLTFLRILGYIILNYKTNRKK